MTNCKHDEFIKKISILRPDDYLDFHFIDKYVNAKTRLKAIHIPCGRELSILPNTFISRGSGCIKCKRERNGKNSMISHDDIVKKFPKSIQALTKYSGANNHMKVHCCDCGSTYNIIARDLIKRGHCSRCKGTYHRTLEDVRAEVNNDTNGEYQLLSLTYKNPHTPVLLCHTVCGNKYNATIHNFRAGKRCPRCNKSKGETKISEVLKNLGIHYVEQFKFSDIKIKRELPVDFYLPEFNTVIEYHGIQHYEPVEFFGGVEIHYAITV